MCEQSTSVPRLLVSLAELLHPGFSVVTKQMGDCLTWKKYFLIALFGLSILALIGGTVKSMMIFSSKINKISSRSISIAVPLGAGPLRDADDRKTISVKKEAKKDRLRRDRYYCIAAVSGLIIFDLLGIAAAIWSTKASHFGVHLLAFGGLTIWLTLLAIDNKLTTWYGAALGLNYLALLVSLLYMIGLLKKK